MEFKKGDIVKCTNPYGAEHKLTKDKFYTIESIEIGGRVTISGFGWPYIPVEQWSNWRFELATVQELRKFKLDKISNVVE